MSDSIHDIRFPNESGTYRKARNELLQAEIALRSQIEQVAELRRNLPEGGAAAEYAFVEAWVNYSKTVSLRELFTGGKNSLLIYSYMFGPDDETPCPMCTSFLDGLDSYWPHIAEHVNLAVIAKSPAEKLHQWQQDRGWKNIRLLSSFDNTYNRDYAGENADGNQLPMMNVFTRDGDNIRHFWASEMLFAPSPWNSRHIDMQWPIWHFFDLTPEGRGGERYPKLHY